MLLNALDEHMGHLLNRNEGLVLQESSKPPSQPSPFKVSKYVNTSEPSTPDEDIRALKSILAFTATLLKNCFCKEWYLSTEVRPGGLFDNLCCVTMWDVISAFVAIAALT